MNLKTIIKRIGWNIAEKFYPNLYLVRDPDINWSIIENSFFLSKKEKNTKIYAPFRVSNSNIQDYTYIAQNSIISNTHIGRFCSIGPNLVCGWGIHPTNGISTSPMFYSTMKQNGLSFSNTNKIDERLPIKIGNDVFIGANVTILDGITIGDGAIIGAGAVVSKNIPAYAIAVGVPIQIKSYRFTDDKIAKLLKIKWWNFEDEKIKDVEQFFFDIDKFLEKYD